MKQNFVIEYVDSCSFHETKANKKEKGKKETTTRNQKKAKHKYKEERKITREV